MSSVADHSDYSEDEDLLFYSGAAKRYKKEKQAVCPTGEVRLKKKEDKISTSARNLPPTAVQQIDDSSDEELFRDTNKESQEVDLDESEVYIHTKNQVETVEDIEEYINILPEVSVSEERKVYSSASIQDVDDVELVQEEDPLCCAPLNESVRTEVCLLHCIFLLIKFYFSFAEIGSVP